MKKRRIALLLSFECALIIFAIFILSCEASEDANRKAQLITKKDIFAPIFQEAKNIEYDYYENGLIKSLSYKVKLSYPGDEIILFYNKEMKKKYYKEIYNSRDCDSKWHHYIDGTLKGRPSVSHRNMCWKNDKDKIMLILKYFYHKKEGSSFNLTSLDDLFVEIYFYDRGR